MALNYYINQKGEIPNTALSMTDGGALERASRFHQTIPGYAPTPLVSLDHLAQRLGVAQVLVKDESRRFGLNAFKALGGSYAMARCLGQRLGWPEEKLTFEALMAPEVREKLGELTFVTATDGNHGRGVAWAAHKLGQKAVVHMPKGSSQARYENIAKEGAQVTIEEVNYDDCVRMAAAEAAQTEHGVIVQDTAWEGYEEIPAWIMQGYGTMAMEAGEQLKAQGCERPTHIFVQAGVGSLAGAVVGYFSNLYADNLPTFVVVEAEAAACLYKGAAAGESGAAPFGALAAMMTMDEYKDLRNDIGLDENSKVLLFSTEGDTDPDRYKNIVWKGLDK